MEELINKIKKYFLIINYDSNYDNDEIEETILLDQESHHSVKSVEFIECDDLINKAEDENIPDKKIDNIFWNNIIDFFKDIFKEKDKSI